MCDDFCIRFQLSFWRVFTVVSYIFFSVFLVHGLFVHRPICRPLSLQAVEWAFQSKFNYLHTNHFVWYTHAYVNACAVYLRVVHCALYCGCGWSLLLLVLLVVGFVGIFVAFTSISFVWKTTWKFVTNQLNGVDSINSHLRQTTTTNNIKSNDMCACLR